MAIKKKQQLVGVDIGSHSIKVVEIDHNKRGRFLKNFGIIGLPRHAIKEGDIHEAEAVAEALKKLFRNLKIRNQNLAVALSGYPVITKRITLPNADMSELEAKIHEQAEQFIPFDVNEVNLDFDILDAEEGLSEADAKDGREKSVDIMLVAAKKDVIDVYVNLIVSAGFNPAILDIDVFALQNAAELSLNPHGEGYAIVNMGAEELNINTVVNGSSLFSRDSSLGGAQITDLIMRHLDVGYEKAEQIKLGQLQGGTWEKALETSISEVVAEWAREIKRALDFVDTTYPEVNIRKIFLCGGSCRVKGFPQHLEAETGLPIEELNPFKHLIVNENLFDQAYLDYMAPQAGVAAGLALRSIGDK